MNESAPTPSTNIFKTSFWKTARLALEQVPADMRKRWLDKVTEEACQDQDFIKTLEALRNFWEQPLSPFALSATPDLKKLAPVARDFAEALENYYEQSKQSLEEIKYRERRAHTRVNVGEDHSCRIRIGDRFFHGIALTNLSAGGCGLKMPTQLADSIEKDTVITSLTLVHANLPPVSIQGVIRWIAGKAPGKQTGFVLVGVEFLDLDLDYQRKLEAHVRKLLG